MKDGWSIPIAFVIGLVVAFLLTIVSTNAYWKTECVSRGAAEWLVDDSGATEFKWLLEPKEKP